LKLVASDLIELGVIDAIIKEPVGGAHRDVDGTATVLKKIIVDQLNELCAMDPEELVRIRLDKYAKMGFFNE
ncbi:acetyl-CoA carboxylase carboxyl transferase subunit alpha, partial [bacterium]|nr:acetyl-CoA carboxylase carboxyl transferase subunit alpha [bacterium]